MYSQAEFLTNLNSPEPKDCASELIQKLDAAKENAMGRSDREDEDEGEDEDEDEGEDEDEDEDEDEGFNELGIRFLRKLCKERKLLVSGMS